MSFIAGATLIISVIVCLPLLSMFRPSQKVLLEKAISMMEDPNSWNFDGCTLDHTSGLSIWIANIPIIDLCFYKPAKLRLRITDAVRLHRAITNLRSRKLMNQLQK